ncbi:MAG: phosphodiester glycosidase family protein [Gemmatimonadetes bacterium]|nr:phosphodiester glycosidase family protein [Gemmatimonadota bacterium]
MQRARATSQHPSGRGLLPLVVASLAAVAATACRSEDAASSDHLVAHLTPDTMRATRIRPGIGYRYVWSPGGPWAVHILDVDLSRCEIGFAVRSPRPEANGRGAARKRVTELFREAGPHGIAAVNGDFFTPEGLPLGTEIAGGVVRTVRGRPAFAWQPGHTPWIGAPTRSSDSTLVVGWPVRLGEPDGRTEVVSGFPEMLDAGSRVGELGGRTHEGFAAGRHPRTAVGFNPASQRLWLVVVDGRRRGYSAGMSLPELAGLFEALGATEALNLDGGGSSVMVIGGRTVSRPSDPEGENPVANALVLYEDETLCQMPPPQ